EHVYLTEGTYVVILRVTDSADLIGTTSTTVTVASAGPTAAFEFLPTTPTSGQEVTFNASGSEPGTGRTITEYSWDFGDMTTVMSAIPTVKHTFATSQTFVVRLTITNSKDETDTVVKEVTVN
ncbi:MAG: PKD domain-containing protein, partial [Vicinamibacterales bacterium]